MPIFSNELIKRLQDYFKYQYGKDITSDEAEAFLLQLSKYFMLKK
jgi:hypothetical protein